MRIVVTGNMGCGKTTVVRILGALLPAYVVFDFDATVASLYQEPYIQDCLNGAFGTHDKRKISDIVHGNHTGMMKLRAIFDSVLIEHTQYAATIKDVILDIPLYFEASSMLNISPDVIVCITACIDDQVRRVQKRSGFDHDKIMLILDSQLPQEIKASLSDYLIPNAGTEHDLIITVKRFVDVMVNSKE